MKIEKVEEKDDKVVFIMKGVKTHFANALRRTVISDIPVFAIEDVYIYENTSVVWDEYIAHRLGLIPLRADPDTYNEDSEERLYLEKQGPCMVTAGDLSGNIEVFDKEIPIIILEEGQRIRLECVAKVGTAKEHAKWQAGLASYRPVVRVEIKRKKEFEKKTGIKAEDVEKENERKEGVSSRTYNICDDLELEAPDIVSVLKKDDAFLFKVESFGNMPAKTLVLKAAEILGKKAENFARFIGE